MFSGGDTVVLHNDEDIANYVQRARDKCKYKAHESKFKITNLGEDEKMDLLWRAQVVKRMLRMCQYPKREFSPSGTNGMMNMTIIDLSKRDWQSPLPYWLRKQLLLRLPSSCTIPEDATFAHLMHKCPIEALLEFDAFDSDDACLKEVDNTRPVPSTFNIHPNIHPDANSNFNSNSTANNAHAYNSNDNSKLNRAPLLNPNPKPIQSRISWAPRNSNNSNGSSNLSSFGQNRGEEQKSPVYNSNQASMTASYSHREAKMPENKQPLMNEPLLTDGANGTNGSNANMDSRHWKEQRRQRRQQRRQQRQRRLWMLNDTDDDDDASVIEPADWP